MHCRVIGRQLIIFFSLWISTLVQSISHPNEAFRKSLNQRLGYIWNGTESSIQVKAASPGVWSPQGTCTTPHLYILLYGHYRSLWTTEAYFEAFAGASVRGNCYFVIYVGPPEIDSRKDNWNLYMTNIQKRGWPKEKTMPSARNAAHFLLAESSIDHLAYSVLDRTGHISHLPFCLALFWHSAWEVMKMSALYHKFEINRNAIVVRTRPDILLRTPYSLQNFSSYVRHGSRGQHIVLGNEMDGSQGDIIMTTSAGTYESDIAKPIDEGMTRKRIYDNGDNCTRLRTSGHLLVWLGMTNGWGFGRSVRLQDWQLPALNDLLVGCVCVDDSATCSQPTCLVTNVESSVLYANNRIVRVRIERHRNTKNLLQSIAPLPKKIASVQNEPWISFNLSSYIDPVSSTKFYCASKLSQATPPGYHPVRKPCFDPSSFGLNWGQRCVFLRSQEAAPLVTRTIWPSWCERTKKNYSEVIIQLNYSDIAWPWMLPSGI